ncbi:longitudinals lacking protein, isoforms N/O/W/X/Y-like isoform X9 [Polistes fuscatus]|uniref:longitudinals lacking protein, isoforms N/O/W/X/Y-like isoform X9 n=1 Tax=Polistes fuscatus TaxID=30207 RepID=UPI001CA9C72C|nr:longitudinals lacking protein, isoforms N/O/W/X/Y-like isoform X9 [Polistes fuscatus]
MDDDQQFCLKWNNHQSTLIQNFDTLLESGTLVDCTLAAEGKYLKAHRVVLSACSPYFEGLLSEHYDKHPVFILKDVKFKELKAMIDYMYRGEVNISQDQLTALLKAAESLQIKGLSESKTGGSNGNNKSVSRVSKVAPQPRSSPLNISYASAGLTIERNRVPRQASSIGDLPEDSHSPQIPKEHSSSREGSQSPTSKKRRKLRRRSAGEDTSVENHEASNSSDIPQQMGVPALAIAPVADEKTNADPTDSLGRSALMTQLTKPADEMLQMPLENPEPSDNLIEPKSEYLEDQEESVEDLTLDDDMNDLNEIEQDTNRAGPSHDTSQHPAGLATWHVTGDRSNTGGVVGSVAGAPGTTDEVFLAAQEAAQAHRDSQDYLRYHLNNHHYNNHHNRLHHLIKEETKIDKRNFVTTLTDSSIKFVCPMCGRSYNRRANLRQHIKYECGQQPRFKCPYCKYRSKKTSNVYTHIRSIHSDIIQLGDFNMVTKKQDTTSNKNHHQQQQQQQQQTSSSSKSKKRFSCPRCGSTFNRKNNLGTHMKYECGQLPRFGCPYCQYCSKKSSNIRAHVPRKHFGRKIYVIDVSTNLKYDYIMRSDLDTKVEGTFFESFN